MSESGMMGVTRNSESSSKAQSAFFTLAVAWALPLILVPSIALLVHGHTAFQWLQPLNGIFVLIISLSFSVKATCKDGLTFFAFWRFRIALFAVAFLITLSIELGNHLVRFDDCFLFLTLRCAIALAIALQIRVVAAECGTRMPCRYLLSILLSLASLSILIGCTIEARRHDQVVMASALGWPEYVSFMQSIGQKRLVWLFTGCDLFAESCLVLCVIILRILGGVLEAC